MLWACGISVDVWLGSVSVLISAEQCGVWRAAVLVSWSGPVVCLCFYVFLLHQDLQSPQLELEVWVQALDAQRDWLAGVPGECQDGFCPLPAQDRRLSQHHAKKLPCWWAFKASKVCSYWLQLYPSNWGWALPSMFFICPLCEWLKWVLFYHYWILECQAVMCVPVFAAVGSPVLCSAPFQPWTCWAGALQGQEMKWRELIALLQLHCFRAY